MKRFWISWWSHTTEPEGEFPCRVFVTGMRDSYKGGEEYSMCALLTARGETDAWLQVAECYPDYEQRFCDEKAADYVLGDRFA